MGSGVLLIVFFPLMLVCDGSGVRNTDYRYETILVNYIPNELVND